MDIRDFLARLKGVRGSGSGEYVCKCPAHDDRTASLCVRDGDKGIVLKCQAGCSTEAVLASMGLKMADLFREPLPAGQRRRGLARGADDSAAAQRTSDPCASAPAPRAPDRKAEATASLRFICAYDYRDEGGKLLFQACRYMDDATGKKTFRLRQPDATARSGWKYSRKGARLVVYRLPELLEAIRQRAPIYVVEGEKDADRMAAMGRAATTNAMGAGKWLEEYGAFFDGAEHVYIIPDNDDVGREHARAVAANLYSHVREIKILDLSLADPDLPVKGDVSDFYDRLGKDADDALNRLIVDTNPFDGDSRSDYEKAIEAYNDVFGYCVDRGRICQTTQDGARPLGSFIAMPRSVVTYDDGAMETKTLVIDGWRADGKPLKRVRVPSDEFSGMGWLTKAWDFDANMMPGNAVRDRLRYAISAVGQQTAARVTEYGHTGWRRIGGKWAYLYQGGAIGAEDVTVNLGSGLSRYRLDGNGAEGFDQIPYETAAGVTMRILDVVPPRISVPLLGVMFLAPLREFLDATGVGPTFALFLLGGTGSHKSTVSSLALSHFGDFNRHCLPASFHSTANYIRRQAFILKDMPIVVDDYHPVTSIQERRAMESTAQTLARAFGDGADRGRLDSAMGARTAQPPRGVAILSGEDTPGIGQSGLARYYIINMLKSDLPEEIHEELTELQELARKGYLQKSMQGYIKWLMQQTDELPERLHEMFLAHRVRAAKLMPDQHGRSPETVAHIMIGYELMLNYMRDIGLLTTEECRAESARAWRIVVENSRSQNSDLMDERPSRMFLTAIGELLATHAANVRDLRTTGGDIPKEMIGYCDAMFYYLLPNAAYRAVARLCTDQGFAFPITMKMLYKQLREDGILGSGNSDRSGAPTKGKWIDGRTQRLLWIPRVEIDGRKDGEQIRMDLQREAFIEVDEDLPDGFEDDDEKR